MASRGKYQDKKIDEMIQTIAREEEGFDGKQISGKLLSLKILDKFHINVNPKKCYQRFKNYLSPQVNPKFPLNQKQIEEIFALHCHGHNNEKIKEKLGLKFLNQNTLKNKCKMPKEKMGRILKTIMTDQFQSVKVDAKLFSPKDQFRVLLILFSTAPLLSYYFRKGISIYKLQRLTDRYDDFLKELNEKASQDKTKEKILQNHFQEFEKEEKQLEMRKLKLNIMNDLESILQVFSYERSIYQTVYNDPEMKNSLIGTKDKHLEEKFLYTKAIILNKPLKLCQNEKYINHQTTLQINSHDNLMSMQEELKDVQSIEEQSEIFWNFDPQTMKASYPEHSFFIPQIQNKSTSRWATSKEEDFQKMFFVEEESNSVVNQFLSI